jgi:prolyl oligopeptidase
MASRVNATRLLIFTAAVSLFCGVFAGAQKPSATLPEDKYIWLEEVSSPRAMEWVNTENTRSMKVFESDPHWKPFVEEAVKLAGNPERLPVPALRGTEVYNSWRDKDHPRGVLRKTSVADYLSANPHWQTVIDFDALGKQEHVNWVSKGETCLYPGDGDCLVNISDGGEDAISSREFDLKTGRFVAGGFTLPHGKQEAAWEDKDTLLVSRDWGADTMTKSGYPFVVKRWRRGTPLDRAEEMFRGAATDETGSDGRVLLDAQGNKLVFFRRGVTFFEQQYFVQTSRGVERFAIPAKSGISGLISGRVIVDLREDWTPAAGGPKFQQGSLVELKLADVLKDPEHLKPAVVFQPDGQEFLENVGVGRSRLVLTTLANVQGRAYSYAPSPSGWTKTKLALPDNIAVGITAMSRVDDSFFMSVTGFLTPPSVWLGDAAKGTLSIAKTEKPQFDASSLTVDQLFAKSKDGTKVPYFVVHRKDMKYDGTNATLLTAYGGFEIARKPNYDAVRGKLWLERNGVFVLANIRGGGEFGPAWHEAGLKTNRQRIYDDFAAVGEDLIARKITSSRHLGIEGGSNGGLLVGVEMTQRPDLWNAVVIDVPLLDMLRFEYIQAGASWVAEYGSVNVPAEREFLAKISPYNQLKPGATYPEPFIFTTTKDDRVGPQHARKFAARMEEFKKHFLFYELVEGGHGSGANIEQVGQTNAMTYVYLANKLF